MSAHDDDLTTDLNRELRGRSEAMHGSTLDFGDVQRKARSIRRRRTASAVVGAAAAVALIVPTAALATHSGHRNEPAPANTTSPSVTTTTTVDAQQPAPGVLDASDLPTGAAPGMDYVYQGTLHLTDGSTAEVNTRYAPNQFVELADGSVVWHTADENGNTYIEIRDPDGSYGDPVPTSSDLSVNRPHSIVAWMTPTHQVMIWEGWASEPRPLGDPVPGNDLRIGPLTGDGEAAPGQAGPDCQQTVCSVIVNVHDGQNQPWVVDESGSQPLRDGGYLDVNDVSAAGLTVGFTKFSDFSTCSKLLGSGEFQGFATCKNQLISFSPDGRLIQGLPSYFDGVGPGGIAMYDLSGERLFERTSTAKTQSYFRGEIWEDDTHLLVPTYQDGKWSVVRIASDGTMEYAVAPAKGPYDSSPFVLPTGGSVPAA